VKIRLKLSPTVDSERYTLPGPRWWSLQKRHHAASAQFSKPGQVDDFAIDGGEIHLEVAGMDHHAQGAVHRQGAGISDGVVHLDVFHGQLVQLNNVLGFHDIDGHHILDVVLHQFRLISAAVSFVA